MSYKDDIQEHANEIASQKYDKDFYDLTEKQQDEVYTQAQEQYFDNLYSQADSMAEERKFK